MPSLAHPPDDVVRPVGGPHDLRGDEDDVEEVAEEEEAQGGELSLGPDSIHLKSTEDSYLIKGMRTKCSTNRTTRLGTQRTSASGCYGSY